jgi:hypothetical protein
MNPTIEGFAEFHGPKGAAMLDEYINSLRVSDDLSETMKNMKPFEEDLELSESIDYDKIKCMCRLFNNGIPKQCSRKKVEEEIYCKSHLKKFTEEGIWGFGLIDEVIPKNHVKGSKNDGQRISWRSDKLVKKSSIEKSKKIVKKSIQKIVVVKNLETQLDESSDIDNCVKCNNQSSNNQFSIVDGSKYCLLCYKSYLENVKIECQGGAAKQLPEDDLLSEDNNDYIYYQGVHYYYDKFTNIVALDYEEMGIWNSHDESIDWYNDECMKKHMDNPEYSK